MDALLTLPLGGGGPLYWEGGRDALVIYPPTIYISRHAAFRCKLYVLSAPPFIYNYCHHVVLFRILTAIYILTTVYEGHEPLK